MKPPKPVYSYLAAGLLAAVTLFTFYVFRDYGPQSTIRRFHAAISQDNVSELANLTTDGLNAASTRRMVLFVAQLAERNPTYEIVEMKRLRDVVLAAVEYRFPNGAAMGVVWHVRRMPADWRIDCAETERGLHQRFMGPGSQ